MYTPLYFSEPQAGFFREEENFFYIETGSRGTVQTDVLPLNGAGTAGELNLHSG